MDIIQFINSKDIAEYLRQIDYQFSPEQAMFLIHEGRNIPLKEKHVAYEELIQLYPDYRLKERREEVFTNQTLASFLRAYIDKENKLMNNCQKDGDNAIYYSSYYNEDDGWILPSANCPVYHTFRECLDATIKDSGKFLSKLSITKKCVSTNETIALELLPDGTVLKVEGSYTPEDDFAIACAFEMMWIKIPTPFKRGDIVISCKEKIWDSRAHEEGEGVFVLSELCTWGSKELAENGYKNSKTHRNNERDFDGIDKLIKHHEENGDISDMIAVGYFVGDDGTIFHDHTVGNETYLDYEYYRGELTGKRRILKAVSNYLKGKIPLELLMQAYQTILLEEKVKSIKKYHLSVYWDDSLELAGLKNEKRK